MIGRRRSFFVEAICYLLEGIEGSSSEGGPDFNMGHAFYLLENDGWGAGPETVLDFINWAEDKTGRTTKDNLQRFLKHGIEIFDEALSPVIPPTPTWKDFTGEKEQPPGP